MYYRGVLGFLLPKKTTDGIWIEEPEEINVRGRLQNAQSSYTHYQSIASTSAMSVSLRVNFPQKKQDMLRHIRYAEYMGEYFEVTQWAVQWPAITISLGGQYAGPRKTTGTPDQTGTTVGQLGSLFPGSG